MSIVSDQIVGFPPLSTLRLHTSDGHRQNGVYAEPYRKPKGHSTPPCPAPNEQFRGRKVAIIHNEIPHHVTLSIGGHAL
jgi:hypothetical protein